MAMAEFCALRPLLRRGCDKHRQIKDEFGLPPIGQARSYCLDDKQARRHFPIGIDAVA